MCERCTPTQIYFASALRSSSMLLDAMPYAPGGEGLLGHNQAFRNDRMGVLRAICAMPAPVMRLNLPFPGIRAVVVNDPDVVQEVLVEKSKSFDKSDMLRF